MALKTTNVTRTNRFEIHIEKLPIASHHVTNIDIEAISLNEAIVPNIFVDQPIPGEKIVYGGLDITCAMDENYDVYTEVYNYLQTMVPDYSVASERKMLFTDITVNILNNKRSGIVRTFKFEDAWITSISPVSLDFSVDDPTQAILTFRYHQFEVLSHDADTTGMYDYPYQTAPYRKDVVDWS